MLRLQTAYIRHPSTEMALLRVIFDLLRAADNRRMSLIGLLNLSAAFDCVHHDILYYRDSKLHSILMARRYSGSSRFSPSERNKSAVKAISRLLAAYCAEVTRALCLDLYFSFYTLQNCVQRYF
jgi:hypothetical protein